MLGWEGVTEFVAVVESGSFTGAAQRLEISVAQVSRQVSALEKRLACQLLHRTTRKVSVTEAGQLYYQYGRQVLDGLADAERAVSNLQSTPSGKIKMTAPNTYGETKIAPILNDFVAQYPEIELHCVFTNQKIDLIDGGFDVAIRLGRLEDSTLVAKRLGSRRQYVCASPAYISANGEPHLITELNRHNCLQGSLEYWRFQEKGLERNIKVSGNIHFNSGIALLDAALKGLGVVQLPDYYVQEYINNGQLSVVLQSFQTTDEGIWALYPKSKHLSSKIRRLVDFLGERLR